ncbi:unnamed protein product [Clonostachys chloroleuca]|uniref:NACHT domain-containing protein n=1 Tax=Clonostachys chloroleuca TaxID=1926264 RepID=A0AA35Q9X8_9HYPO|nr:unnamed protein product [Clonostachys chloroleuca]
MATTTDSEQEGDYQVVSKDSVPAPVAQAGRTWQKERDTIQKWLQPTDYNSPGNEYMKHLHSYVPGTGSWVRESPIYSTWAESKPHSEAQHGILHVRGVAGSGKSVLAASIISQLQEEQPNTPVLFFFFRQIVEKNHSAKYLVRDFASQLLPHSQSLVSKLYPMSQKQGVDGTELSSLWDAILQTLESMARVYCVVDALDEMDDGDFDFIHQLVRLGALGPGQVKLLLTSRPLAKIEEALRDPHIQRFKLETSLIDPDIEKYVGVSLVSLDPSLRPDTEDLVKKTICKCAQGLFLHARLVTDNLTNGLKDGRITEEMLPECLERLPQNLKDVYEQMLVDHALRSGVSTKQQAHILMCVTHSSRPLRLIELGSLVSSFMGLVNLKKGKDLVLASCGPLLEILEDQTVSVIHHSFTEFLRDESRQQNPASFPVLNSRYAHSMLAILSLQYLDRCPLLDTSTDTPGDSCYDDYGNSRKEKTRRHQVLQDMNFTLPLLYYSVENLNYHLDNAEPGDIQLLDTVSTCLAPGKPAFALWMYHHWQLRFCNSFTTAHLAAFADMPLYVIEHLGPNDTKDGGGRTPLSYAADKSAAKTVKFLLSHGADPKSYCSWGLTPLHYAIREGPIETVQLLLEAGVSPLIPTIKSDRYDEYEDEGSSFGHTALEYAFTGNHEAIIECFMPLITPEYANKCLHWARETKIIEAVLKAGHVDVDCFAGGSTKLFKATTDYDFETMKVLIQHGANVNQRCSGDPYGNEDIISLEIDNPRGPMPIHAFAGYEQSFSRGCSDLENAKKCLRLLLDNGADINATTDGEKHTYRGRDGNFTPLYYAVKKNINGYWFGVKDNTKEKFASLLLKAGADPNAKSTCGFTPLHVANPECLPLFDLLVAHSADVNAKDDRGSAPILKLIQQYQVDLDIKVFEKLIECGADANTSDDNGDTIFHMVLGHLEKFKMTDLPFFQLLLRSGADINKPNKKGDPPLFMYQPPEHGSWFSYRRNPRDDEPLLRALVEIGLDMQAYNGQGASILSALIPRYRCEIKTVEKFIRLGADITARNNDGSTLLHVALRSKLSIDWVNYFSSKGVDPLATDKNGRTLIHMTIQHYSADETGRAIVGRLIELGISPGARDGFGSTALHLASKKDHRERVTPREDENDWVDAIIKTGILGAQDVNDRDDSGATALHNAAAVCEFTVAKLLQAGADPTALTLDGLSPLHIACRSGQPNVVGLLLATYKERGELGQMINLHDALGERRTSLHLAARAGIYESVSYLLNNSADIASLDKSGFTALHALVEVPPNTPWLEILDLLLNFGADLHAKASVEQNSATALELATKNGREAMVQALVQHGATSHGRIHGQSPEPVISTKTLQELLESRNSPEIVRKVEKVLQTNDYATIKEFVRLGGSLMSIDQFKDKTILHKMVDQGNISLINHFRDEASKVDQSPWMIEEEHPGTLLADACERGLPGLDIIKCLVENIGLDPNMRSNRRGFTYKLKAATPLHFVACGTHFWHADAVTYLLSHGADIEAKNKDGQTPLLCAISTQHPNGFWKELTIKRLLDHGANPNFITESGASCLAEADSAEVLKLLLEHGADISATPGLMEPALKKMDADMVEVLLNAGVNPNYHDSPDGSYTEDKASSQYPLHNAARPATKENLPFDWDSRKQKITETLLQGGADPYASYSDHSYVLQVIVEENGFLDPFFKMVNLDTEKRGRHGRTLLLSACVVLKKPYREVWDKHIKKEFPPAANPKAVLALLARGVIADVTDDQERTPLHCLCTMTHPYDEDHQQAFDALVSSAPSTIHAVDNAGFKPLHRASQSCQIWAIWRLVDLGADLREPDPDGNTALHFLAPKMVGEKTSAAAAQAEFKLILAQGLSINARNNKGETPLFLSISAEWSGTRLIGTSYPTYALENDVSPSDVLDLYIGRGADIFTADDEGKTLLHAAAGRRIEDQDSNTDQITHIENVFKKLMDMGLDPRQEDIQMRTAIDMAVARGRTGIVGFFAEK